MPAQILVMYKQPTDTAHFDKYYVDVHTPLAKKIPGLNSLVVGRSPVSVNDDPSPYYLIAELNFDSMESLGAGMASEEGKVTAADLANFASGGVVILTFEAPVV